MNKMSKLTDDDIILILKMSKSMREVILKIGYKSAVSGSYNLVRNELKRRNIEIPEYNFFGDNKFLKRKENNEIFINGSDYSRQNTKKRIIDDNLIEYKCSKCGNDGTWMGMKLSLQLEHKNGINNDNRLDNLCFLCPNCHSQTSTFSGKSRKKYYYCNCGSVISKSSKNCNKCSSIQNGLNNRKVSRPNIDVLIQEIKDIGYEGVGRKYGVSGNAIKKWLK